MKIRYFIKAGAYWLDFKDGEGTRRRVTTGCATLQEAERAAPAIVARTLSAPRLKAAALPTSTPAATIVPQATSMTLREAFKAGLKVREQWISAKDTSSLEHTYKALGLPDSFPCSGLTRDKVRALRTEWLAQPGKREGTTLSASTINHRLSMLSVLLEVADLPPHGVKHLSVESGRRKRRARDEELQAVAAWCIANHKRKGALTLADVLQFGLGTTARASEILGLTWGNVYLDKRMVMYVDTKNGDSRPGVMSAAVERIIRARADNGLDGPFADLTQGQLNALWSDARRAIGLGDDPEFVFHVATRHEGLSRLGDMGASAFQIKAFGGHRSITAADRYVKPGAESLRGLADGINPSRDDS